MDIFGIICSTEIYKDFVFPGITAFIALFGIILATIGGRTAIKTYKLNSEQSKINERQRRFEFFNGIFNKYLDDERTQDLQELFSMEEQILAKGKAINPEDQEQLNKLKNWPQVKKYYFLGIVEQVAIALKSNLITREVVLYMFGFFSIRAYESGNFWSNLMPDEKNSPYWVVFSEFAQEMKKIAAEGHIDTKKLVY